MEIISSGRSSVDCGQWTVPLAGKTGVGEGEGSGGGSGGLNVAYNMDK